MLQHLYHFQSLDERASIRRKLFSNPQWLDYVREAKKCLVADHAEIFSEATDVMQAAAVKEAGTGGESSSENGTSVFELREYQLIAGYSSVTKLREAFVRGIGSKVRADPNGELKFFGYIEFGTLNKVIELWKYPSAQACLNGRVASRSAVEWREVVGAVAPYADRFQSQLMIPASFSPWR